MWLLLGVYADTDYKEQRILWHEIVTLIDQGIPTMVAGNFNCIVGANDKRGSKPFVEDIASREFGCFLQSNGLVDLGFMAPHYTWCNNHSDRATV